MAFRIIPSDKLLFVGPMKEKISAIMVLKNMDAIRRLGFKVKSNAPKGRVHVSNTRGFIEPASSLQVTVTIMPDSSSNRNRHLEYRLLVETFSLKLQNVEIDSVWPSGEGWDLIKSTYITLVHNNADDNAFSFGDILRKFEPDNNVANVAKVDDEWDQKPTVKFDIHPRDENWTPNADEWNPNQQYDANQEQWTNQQVVTDQKGGDNGWDEQDANTGLLHHNNNNGWEEKEWQTGQNVNAGQENQLADNAADWNAEDQVCTMKRYGSTGAISAKNEANYLNLNNTNNPLFDAIVIVVVILLLGIIIGKSTY